MRKVKSIVLRLLVGKEITQFWILLKNGVTHQILLKRCIYNQHQFSEDFKVKMILLLRPALAALDIQYGPSHTEFKVDKHGNVNIIEIAARMAAENICDLVQITTGLDYLKATIDIALGKETRS